MEQRAGIERHDVIVVGGGQAGLAAGHFLRQRGIQHVILDAHARVGDAWRERWTSLRLFTPAAIDGLPGMPFPGAPGALPSKDEMADYLLAYAVPQAGSLRHGVTVERLERAGDGFVLTAGERRFEARQVIVATGFLSRPVVPPFATELAPGIRQLHSSAYRDPASVAEGPVLLVGAGNSGVEIAHELAMAGHRTFLSGHSTFIPALARIGGGRLFFAAARRLLTLDSPLGRRASQGVLHSAPIIRLRPGDLATAGIERVPRLSGVRGGSPLVGEDRLLEVATVIWCTGFRPAFEWIQLPVLDARGLPRHERGLVPGQPGLSFLGLPFQSGFLSPLVGGVGADAATIVDGVARRLASPTGRPVPATA